MKKLALLTAAGAALFLMGGAALAQTDSPNSMGASKSHQGNQAPAASGSMMTKNPNAPATDKKNNPSQSGPATSSGGTMGSDPTSMNPRNTQEKK